MTKTIMVVDDEADNRDTVRTLLEKNGYNVITAVSGDDCLKKFPNQKVDLILLDIMMPGKPVKDVIPKVSNCKIIFLSAVRMSDAEKEQLTKEKNIIGFIEKPFDLTALLKKVKSVLT